MKDFDVELVLFPLVCPPPPCPLHPQEEEIFRTLSTWRRPEWLSARLALKWLGRRLRPDLGPQEILTVEGRKPALRFPDGQRLFASVAHDGCYLVAAAGPRPLGVDLEQPSPSCLRLASRFRPVAATDTAGACRWWVGLEALSKASGQGLTRLLREGAAAEKDRRFITRTFLFKNRFIGLVSGPGSEPVFLTLPQPPDV